MKKVMKVLGYLVGGVALLVGLFATYVSFKGVPKYPVEMSEQVKNLIVPVDSAHIA